MPGPLVLPAGKFFFGYKYVPFDPSAAPKKTEEVDVPPSAFQGEGNSLRKGAKSNASAPAAAAAKPAAEEKPDP